MRSANTRYSADPVGLGAQGDLIGAPEPVSIQAVLAGQIAAGRALLMTFYVTQGEAEDRGGRGRQAGGVALAARYAPARAVLPGPGCRQFVVIASGLSWAAVLVAFAGNPGTGREAVSPARGCAWLPAGARARWSRSAPPSCRWAGPSGRSGAIPRHRLKIQHTPGVAADGARSRRAVGRPAGVGLPGGRRLWPRPSQGPGQLRAACPGLRMSSWVHPGSLRPGTGVARAGADSRSVRR